MSTYKVHIRGTHIRYRKKKRTQGANIILSIQHEVHTQGTHIRYTTSYTQGANMICSRRHRYNAQTNKIQKKVYTQGPF